MHRRLEFCVFLRCSTAPPPPPLSLFSNLQIFISITEVNCSPNLSRAPSSWPQSSSGSRAPTSCAFGLLKWAMATRTKNLSRQWNWRSFQLFSTPLRLLLLHHRLVGGLRRWWWLKCHLLLLYPCSCDGACPRFGDSPTRVRVMANKSTTNINVTSNLQGMQKARVKLKKKKKRKKGGEQRGKCMKSQKQQSK